MSAYVTPKFTTPNAIAPKSARPRGSSRRIARARTRSSTDAAANRIAAPKNGGSSRLLNRTATKFDPPTSTASAKTRRTVRSGRRTRRGYPAPSPRSTIYEVKVAVLRFPGTWSERDFAHALGVVGADADILWRADPGLRGYDAAIVPGGFTYGDYLRAGAIAAISPAADELRRAGREGMPILGSCNGFQILCEIGLLPGALVRNRQGEFRCDWVHMRIESDRTPFTGGLRGEILRM